MEDIVITGELVQRIVDYASGFCLATIVWWTLLGIAYKWGVKANENKQ